MIPELTQLFIIHYYPLSGNDNRREFPSGVKARRAFTKMATNYLVAICNHRFKDNRRSFPYFKNRKSLSIGLLQNHRKSISKSNILTFFYLRWVSFRREKGSIFRGN